MADKNISIVIMAKNLTARVFRGVSNAAKSMASGIASAIKNSAIALGIIGAAAVAVGKRMVSQYQSQAAAEAKLSATLKATGYAAGFTTGELKKQAAQLQKTTGVGDETILSMQGILATFKNVRGDVFTQATSAILDMGAAMGKAGQGSADVEAAVIQVGKALNDPIAGISALSRVGVQFSNQQKTQIKVLQESGDLMGAQAIILRELETQFGGTAKAVADSQHGMMQLKAVFGDAQEEIGRVIAESDVFNGVIKRVTRAIEDLIESGAIDMWAENVRAAIARLVPVMEKMGGGWTWIKDKVAGAAAFWGAVSAGAGMNEAIKAMDTIPKKVEQEKQTRLKAIREEKKARAQEAEEAEKSVMKVATVKREADEAANKAAEKAKKLEENAAKLKDELAEEERRQARETASEKLRLLNDQLEKSKEIAAKTIKGYIDERREAKKAKADDEEQFRNADKLAAKQKRGVKLSKRDREILDTAREIKRERDKLKGLEGQVTEAEKQLAALDRQGKSLDEIKALLADNLKEQQALSKAG